MVFDKKVAIRLDFKWLGFQISDHSKSKQLATKPLFDHSKSKLVWFSDYFLFFQSELERFQESLSRCVLQCQDEVKDKVFNLLHLSKKLACFIEIKRILLITLSVYDLNESRQV